MEYSSKIDRTSGICTIFVTGQLHSPKDSKKLQRIAIELHNQKAYCLFLFDLTQAEIISSTMSAYDVAHPPQELEQILRSFKAAILYPELTDHTHFFENVSVNRGYNIKVFDKLNEAQVWLGQ